MILAGDIGGTNTRLAVAEAKNEGLHLIAEKTFPSREQTSLEAALVKFLSLHPYDITRASFGIAGPVWNGRCEATNLPWVVDSTTVAKQLRLERVGLMNDLVSVWRRSVSMQSEEDPMLSQATGKPLDSK